MAYREPAPMPVEVPAPTVVRPLERLAVERYPPWSLALMVLGFLALAAVGAFAMLRSSAIGCTRPFPEAVPQCVGTDRVGFARTMAFELPTSSFGVIERESDDGQTFVILTPGGELRGAVDRTFADKVVSGAKAFREGRALRWEATRSANGISIGIAVGGAFLAIFMLVFLRGQRVTIDRDAKTIAVRYRWPGGGGSTHAFGVVQKAEREGIDESDFYALVLVPVDENDERRSIAEGRERDVDAAAIAINRALRSRKKDEEDATSSAAP